MPPLPQPFSAVLLAGGKSTRMGTDKASLVVDGEVLWQRQWSKLEEIGASERLISGPSDGPWNATGIKAVLDRVSDAGPLGGLAAALDRACHPWLLVLAVDLPDVSSALLRGFVHRAMISSTGQVPACGDWIQPLAAVYPKGALALAEECLASPDRSMASFFEAALELGLAAPHCISQAEQRFFRNLNTPADLTIQTNAAQRA